MPGRFITVGYAATGSQRRKTVYGKTRREVGEKLREMQRRQANGEPVLDRAVTVGDFLEEWIRDTLPNAVRESTAASYADQLRRHVIPELGRRKLKDLTPADVQRWIQSRLALGLSARTVQYQHAILRRAIGQAHRWGMVGRNVVALTQAPRVERPEVEPLSIEQARELLRHARSSRLYALYAVALAIGLRKGEALALRWEDVDLDVGALRVRRTVQRINGRLVVAEPKTPRSRRAIPLPGTSVAALREHRRRQNEERLRAPHWQDPALVFTTGVGTLVEPRNLSREFGRLCEKAGLEGVRFHDLRHTCASMLLAQGVEPRVIMETLGHSVIGTTLNLYAHVLPVLQRQAAERMDGLFPIEEVQG